MFSHADFKIRYWGKKTRKTRTSPGPEHLIAESPRVSPLAAAPLSGEASGEHPLPGQDARPVAGRSTATPTKTPERRAGWGTCLRGSPSPETPPGPPSSSCGAAEGQNSLFTRKREAGASPRLLLRAAPLAALWPPLRLRRWQYAHLDCFSPHQKAAFLAVEVK